MGSGLLATGVNITYSCSWPAYLGDNETTKPWGDIINAACQTWRNWDDIQCGWDSLASIIEHWGTYGAYLASFAGPSVIHDPDMLLIGNTCISDDEARTQMAIWSIVMAPLLMGNDLRNVSASTAAILLNAEAVAVNQDAAARMGYRVSPSAATEVWARNLTGGNVAVALFNKLGGSPPPAPPACPTWNITTDGYLEACGGGSGDLACFTGVALDDALAYCCGNPSCAGFSYAPDGESGCYKTNTACGFTNATGYMGFDKPSFTPTNGTPANITLTFADVGLTGAVAVRDLWAHADLGTFTGTYTALNVPFHGSAFLRLSPA